MWVVCIDEHTRTTQTDTLTTTHTTTTEKAKPEKKSAPQSTNPQSVSGYDRPSYQLHPTPQETQFWHRKIFTESPI